MNDNLALTKGCQQSREELAVAVITADMHYSHQVQGGSVNLFKAADSSEKIIQRNIFEDMKQLFSRKTHVILLQFKTLPLRYPIFIIIDAIRIPPKTSPNNIGMISSVAGEVGNS